MANTYAVSQLNVVNRFIDFPLQLSSAVFRYQTDDEITVRDTST